MIKAEDMIHNKTCLPAGRSKIYDFYKNKKSDESGVCEFLAERLGFFGGDIGRGHNSVYDRLTHIFQGGFGVGS